MIKLELPYPPSVNTYWGFKGSRRFLTKKANLFKNAVSNIFKFSNYSKLGKLRISITIYLYPPDKRKRDIDNVVKSLLDALCQAGIFDDDEQIDVLHVIRETVEKTGKCVVFLEPIKLK